MDFEELILFIFELVGTVAFAVSGAMVAIKKKVDIFGVIVLSVMTALGGGVVRDILIGCLPPRMFSDYRYVLAAVVTSVIVFVAAFIFREPYRKSEKTVDAINNIFDALGLGVFTVMGANVAIESGFTVNGILVVYAQKKNICRRLHSRRNSISSDVYLRGKPSTGNRCFGFDCFHRQNPCYGVQARFTQS